jgi:hypothetical protein
LSKGLSYLANPKSIYLGLTAQASLVEQVPAKIKTFVEDLQGLDPRQRKAQLQTILKTARIYRDGRIELEFRINTSNVTDVDFLELTFDGADIYFPEIYASSNTTANTKKLFEAMSSKLTNVVPLEMHIDNDNAVTFSGNATLLYYQGGNFDIGFTYRGKNLKTEGYENQQKGYKISGAVPVSPPENLLTMKTNQLMIGISWIAIAISIIIPVLTKILLGSNVE